MRIRNLKLLSMCSLLLPGLSCAAARSYPLGIAAAGSKYQMCVKSDGSLWGWGDNANYQMLTGGGPFTSPYNLAQNGETGPGVREISAGGDQTNPFSIIVLENGTALTRGLNTYGRGNYNGGAYVEGTGWVTISAGRTHGAGIRGDGTLWTWGMSDNGSLGEAGAISRKSPKQIQTTDTKWKSVSCGYNYCNALKADGSLWGWGKNNVGGVGAASQAQEYAAPVQLAGSDWATLGTGFGLKSTSAAIKADGTLWVWGWNSDGQVGDGTTTNRMTPIQRGSGKNWKAVSCGTYHCLALTTSGDLYAWGSNYHAELGLGYASAPVTSMLQVPIPYGIRIVSISAGHDINVAIGVEGSVFSWGYATGSELAGLPGGQTPGTVLSNCRLGSQAAGRWHSTLIKGNGRLFTFGLGTAGQLGLGSTANKLSPTPVNSATWIKTCAGSTHTLGILSNGSMWSAGSNSYGQLGRTNTPTSSFSQVGSDARWIDVKCGDDFTLALRGDGTIWGFGRNDVGQLGDGSFTNRTAPTQIPGTSKWIAIAAGSSHGLAIRSNGGLYAWGKNNNGQLGSNYPNNQWTPTQVGGTSPDYSWVAVACGQEHTLALRNDGSLWAWGKNNVGQIGKNSTSANVTIPWNAGNGFISVVSGNYANHNFAQFQFGQVHAWGSNSNGQLGDGTTSNRSNLDWWLPVTATYLAAGGNHTLARFSSYAASWGSNLNGELGLGHNADVLSASYYANY